MQERPSTRVLLTAIARFLSEEARPALADPRLAFRALIAANLASIVAAELTAEETQSAAELDRLHTIFGENSPIPTRTADRAAEIHALDTKLAALLRSSDAASVPAAMLAAIESHLMQTLGEKLAVDNPKFDTSLVIE